MTDGAPSILVVDEDRDERALITAVLREAGFTVIEAAEACSVFATMSRQRFAAAVVALPDGEVSEFLRRARCRQPGLEALVVVEPGAQRLVDEDCGTLLRRPFNARQLLGHAFDLVLREGQPEGEHERGPAAELEIAAAELACLDNRRVAAAASGASRLAQELTRQIGETRALCHRLAAAMTVGDLAPAAGAADG
jgi:DNA-binding response OmpR family regulator